MRRILLSLVAAALAACGADGAKPESSTRAALDGSIQAVFDAALLAPSCATVGPGCTSDTLLAGRGNYEVNASNTINQSCADSAGIAGEDESVEAIRVHTLDGSPLEEGKNVQVDVDVFYVTSPSVNSLFVFAAPVATTPEWMLVGQVNVNYAAPATTFSFSYVLPKGGMQAVRASYRFAVGQTGYPCDPAVENDTDDLAFAVAPGTPDAVPPTVAITAPADGATVSGIVPVEASASDDVYLSSVRFFVDGSSTIATVSQSPFVASWDTRGLTVGPHTLSAEAMDAAGNVATSTITLTVADVTGPVVGITTPIVPGTPLHGLVSISGTATDLNGAVRAELWVAIPRTATPALVASAPVSGGAFTIQWDTVGVPTDLYLGEIIAYDAAGNTGGRTFWFTVDNNPPIVAITSPSSGTYVTGKVTLVASVTDESSLLEVSFYVDGALLTTLPGAGSGNYSTIWNAPKRSGLHVLTVVATDKAGNVTTSESVTVTTTGR